jgi:putative Ca2+/H+ antiporter (TMEM165/GDT1 family)
MEALFFSTLIVALAEMGDKTQLLSFVLAARLKRKGPIMLGILVATLANHFLVGTLGAWLGKALAHRINMQALRWVAAGLFVVMGILTLLA